MTITHGYSQEHRPDLKHAVLELMVSQDGGVPVSSKSWEGHTSESQVFQERAQALLAAFQQAPSPRYLSADAQRYPEDNAPNRQPRGLITRIPHPLRAVAQVITQALAWDTWPQFDDTTRDQCLE
jgi:transposase